ncbi:Alpha/Beta hydrolase protein [Plectosphaerella plurivora]|uniref:Alpha/Beta hydrolase protein n=1 Tax=Plectosphaerella plurivora TaxID=936078 RepID=A0A9P8VHC3_9PEZI|nr:Alpha/Beta hydrolase protein [Plectosphaerella plurivora]
MPFNLDPEFAAAFASPVRPDESRPAAAVGDIQSRRKGFADKFTPLLATQFPRDPRISTKDYFTKSLDGHDVLFRWCSKPDCTPDSAIIFIHSGGLILANVSTFDGIIEEYVDKSGHRYLKALEDVYAGLEWLHEHAPQLGVNPDASAFTVRAQVEVSLRRSREKQGPRIAKQVLIYPMLDDRVIKANPLIAPYLAWSAADNETGWDAYLGIKRGGKDVLATVVPARLEDPAGLPPLYVEVGELDLFRDQVLAYVRKYLESGVSVMLHLLPGVPHGFEWFAPRSNLET